MRHIKANTQKDDERLPFTCKITKKDCGGEINSLIIELDSDLLSCIPLSDEIVDTWNTRFLLKLERMIVKEVEIQYNKIKDGKRRKR